MHLSRRTFVGLGSSVLGSVVMQRSFGGIRAAAQEKHFLIEIVYRGGWDCSYLFDARPLSMTGAGIAHNYLGEDPTELLDHRGGRALVTSLFEPLRPHFAAGRFSILNGVHMAPNFDGHEQNLSYLLTGNPFGGDAIFPGINCGPNAAPLDYLQLGRLSGVKITNSAKSLPLDARGATSLIKAIKGMTPLDLQSPIPAFVMERLALAGTGSGAFSSGARRMASGLAQSSDLAERIRTMRLDAVPASGDIPLPHTLKYVRQCFGSGIVNSALIELARVGIDSHDVSTAKQQPALYKLVAAEIASIFDFLASNPVSDADSMPLINCTTVIVTSEFGRSLRQAGANIDQTGTDHNQFANAVLIGGRGVRGGLIIGAGDQESLTSQVSPAHHSLDKDLVKSIGKPFDFDSMQSSPAMPEVYDPRHYLTYASVANSVYSLFGADPKNYWSFERGGPPARLLGPELLANL